MTYNNFYDFLVIFYTIFMEMSRGVSLREAMEHLEETVELVRLPQHTCQ